MPRIDTSRDRRRLRAAILVAVALHGLLFALFAFLPADGIAWVADGSAPGLGGSGYLAGPARPAGMRVIPILVAPIGRDAEPPRDAAASRSANDQSPLPARMIANARAIAERDAPSAPDGSMDIAMDNAQGTSGTNNADGVYRTGAANGASDSGNVADPPEGAEGAAGAAEEDGVSGAGVINGAYGPDGADSFNAQRAFAYWLDSAIRARLSYPERARARNAEGTVVVALSVPADGSRCDALVAKSSGSSILDRAAVELIGSLFPAKVAPGSPFSAPVRISFTLTAFPAR